MELNLQTTNQNTTTRHLARMVFTSFLITFILARIVVFLIMSRDIPDLYLHAGGTHVHHLNYGIFLLSGIGAYMLFVRPDSSRLKIVAIIYGIAMALTFDEFGMWIHLGGSYWQRASWDAVVILTSGFGLIAYAPSIKRFKPQHWYTAVVLLLMLTIFIWLFVRSYKFADKVMKPKLEQIESTAPQ